MLSQLGFEVPKQFRKKKLCHSFVNIIRIALLPHSNLYRY